LVLSFVAVIVLAFFIFSKLPTNQVDKDTLSSEEIEQALEEGSTVVSLAWIEREEKTILTQDMTDDEKYQAMFDLILKARENYIKENGKEDGDYSAFRYSVCTPQWNSKERYIRIDGIDTSVYGSTNEIIIPADIEGIPVMEIGDYAFEGCEAEEISLTWSIVKIDTYAFRGCKNLKSIKNAGYIIDIGYSAFGGCENLASFDRIAAYGMRNIGGDAFIDCSSLSNINLGGETVFSSVDIGNGAFKGGSSLQWVILPENVNAIGNGCFNGSTNLYKVAEVNKNMGSGELDDFENMEGAVSINCKKIDSEAFYGCTSITKVILGEKVKDIGLNAFSGCTNLTEVEFNKTKVGDGNTIGFDAFWGTGLETVEIPGSYTFIGLNAFSGSKIRKFILHGSEDGSEQKMDHSALSDNELLEEVYIPDNFTDVSLWSFDGKNGILRATIYSNSPAVQELYEEYKGTGNEFVLLPWEQ